jgi:hypothetical protein
MARYDDRRDNVFLALWTLAVLATTVSFLFYLGLRVRSVELGYELGREHAELARLREVERVLELELSSHQTPERVELISRALLGMYEPAFDRVLDAGQLPLEATEVVEEAVAAAPESRGAEARAP